MGEASPSMESQHDPLVGRTINDRFEVLELIARGGMGRVYRARQQPLGREVALKVLDPRGQADLDPEFQARFFLEAATSAKLSHPNTVTVFDYGKTSDGVFFIAMELVEGRTLSAHIKAEAPFDAGRAISIAAQIARSLREAHSLGVIHRDLKPANVLITQHADELDFVKVLDFGLVKNVAEDDELTQAGLFMGSPKYMAPEQIQGGHVDGRTDVYALGVILFYMLTGRVPFDGANQVQILMAHMREAVPPIVRDDGVPVPQGIAQLTQRCLAKDPEARFAGMNELITALKHAGSALGAAMHPSGAYTLGDPDHSIMRHMPMTTPGSGIQVAGSLHTITGSYSGLEDINIDELTAEPPRRSRAPLYALLGVLALGAGGAAAYFAQADASAAHQRASAEPAATQPAEAVMAAAAPPVAVVDAPVVEAPVLEAPAVPPARIVITLRSEPPASEVFVGDRSYGNTPATIEWMGADAEAGRQVTFRFVHAGYRDSSVTRTLRGDSLEVEAALRPIARRPAGAASSMAGSGAGGSVAAPSGRAENFRENPY